MNRSLVASFVLCLLASACIFGGGAQTRTISVDYTSDEFPSAFLTYFPSHVSVHPGDTVLFQQAWSGEVATRASERFLANAAALREECRRAGAHLIVASQQAKSELVEREQMRGLRYEDEVKLVQESLRPGAEGSEWRTLVRGTDDPNDPRTPRLVRRLVEAHFGGIFLIHARIMRDLREWAAANSVDFVDVIQILDPDRDHLTSWVHLDREANQRVAEALAARILTLPEAASRGVDP